MGPSLFFPGLPLNENTRRTIAQKIRALFAGSIAGAWYDPSDLSTMFTTSTGQTSVTTTGDPVGLILDKRLGLVRRDELVTNGDFTTTFDFPWAPINSSTVANADGTCTVTLTGVAYGGISQVAISMVAGSWYEIIGNFDAGNTGDVVAMRIADSTFGLLKDIGTTGATPVTIRQIVRATATGTGEVTFYANGLTGEFHVYSVSVRELPGNHAFQATSASRPIFRDVGGYRYLEYDGVDDHMIVELTTTIVGPALYGAGGVLQDSAGTAFMRHFGCGVTGVSDAGNNAYCDLLSAGSPAQICSYRASASRGFSGAVADVPMVAESIFDGVNAFTAFNAVDGTPAASTGAFSIQQVYIGASPNLVATDFLIGNHYALILREGPITSAQRVAVRQLLAGKCGVTI